jgi:uncharacterized protein (DUF1330 family)
MAVRARARQGLSAGALTDPDRHKHYAAEAPVAFKKYGATILARGGTSEQMEGQGRPRNVVIEFPSLQAALECYKSAEYQAARAKRVGAGEADVVIVEGV